MTMHVQEKFLPDNSAINFIPFDDFKSDVLRGGYEYWCSKRNGRKFPAREDIRPRDIAASLRYTSLIKVEDDDFVYRIVGDVIVMSYSVPLQNRHLSDLAFEEPAFGSFIIPMLRRAVESRSAIAVRGKVGRDVSHVNFTDCENLLLPLGPDDDTVDHILTFSSYLSYPFG